MEGFSMEYRAAVSRRSFRWLDGQPDFDRFVSIILRSAFAEGLPDAEAASKAKSMAVSWLFDRIQQQFESLKLKGMFADLLEADLLAIDYEDLAQRAVNRSLQREKLLFESPPGSFWERIGSRVGLGVYAEGEVRE
jgi:hypothetical protein